MLTNVLLAVEPIFALRASATDCLALYHTRLSLPLNPHSPHQEK